MGPVSQAVALKTHDLADISVSLFFPVFNDETTVRTVAERALRMLGDLYVADGLK